MPASVSGPTSSPNPTNSIAAVTGVPDSRPEIAATATSASATSASAHASVSIARSSPPLAATASPERGDGFVSSERAAG